MAKPLQPPTYDTPEAAAMEGFPPAHCRVVASRVHGDEGYVLLDTDPAGGRYLYGVCVGRVEGGWMPGSSGNGGGWTATDPDHELGTLAAWDEAPPGADRVRVAWNGEVREAPVENGVYLVAWWRVPCPARFPRAQAFRIAGEWDPTAAPGPST